MRRDWFLEPISKLVLGWGQLARSVELGIFVCNLCLLASCVERTVLMSSIICVWAFSMDEDLNKSSCDIHYPIQTLGIFILFIGLARFRRA